MSTPEDEDVVAAAARNNAELCSLVCRSHGIDGTFAADAWTSSQRTPPLYPDAVTLDAGADVGAVLDGIDPSSGASVKDSFATLDLAPYGFRILFSAEWIFRPAPAGRGGANQWSPVEDGDAPWRGPELIVVRGDTGSATLNRSDAVVGVSSLSSSIADLDGAWDSCLDAISARFPALGVVGYESDEMLDAAHRVGFRSIGPLRVWIKD